MTVSLLKVTATLVVSLLMAFKLELIFCKHNSDASSTKYKLLLALRVLIVDKRPIELASGRGWHASF